MKKNNDESKHLMHELQIHQIDLESQNEELKRVNLELENSIKEYSRIYDFAPIGCFTLDEKGNIIRANTSGKILLGISSGFSNCLNIKDFIDRESILFLDSFISKTFEDETRQDCELDLVKTDGSRVHCRIHAVAIHGEDNKKEQTLLSVSDLTNIRTIENELAESRILDKLKREFFSNISHEFRTPLSVILATIQLMELYENNKSIEQKNINVEKNYNIIKQNCRRLLRLVNNLIDSSKIDSNFYKPIFCNKDIVKVVENITLSVIQFAESKNRYIHFITDIKEKTIKCDQDLIERVILNILSNAIKFTMPGGKIDVYIFEKHGKVNISIKDDGIGISKENLDVVFNRYKQLNRGLTKDFEGSGIGLSLAKSFMEMHGGTISVNSILGKGSEFIITLPDILLSEEAVLSNEKSENSVRSQIERMNIELSDIYLKS